METKDFALHVKDVSDEGTFEGYASVAGNVDSYGDRVESGAFGPSLAKHQREGTKPLLLWQHNPDEPIGVWESLAEDGKGLYGKARLLKGVRRADEAHILLKGGAIRGISIGYRVVKSEPDGKVAS
jgi:HK97 family phage prohead protease